MIICRYCMHHCHLEEGQHGRCRIRQNRGGQSVCDAYGLLTAIALDPIEKKPLAMFHPGSRILSVGSCGCNLACPFCQNHDISQAGPEEVRTAFVQPEQLAERAEELKSAGNIGVAYTYNEPMLSFEYIRDTGKLVRNRGMVNVIVTNGSFCDEALDAVLDVTDAMNIDLKGFTEAYYRFLGGDLETVKHFIKRAAAACHVELTTLVVPGRNDSVEEMKRLSAWAASVDPEMALHVTRYFPRWKLDEPATPVEKVLELAETARQELHHVFTGNI